MNSIQEINRINQRELDLGLTGNASWHHQYSSSAYIHVGGLSYEMTEGDVLTVFSQFGEIMDINMPRDQESGKPKGFAFLMYEDQRSTVLAVDNMNGALVLGRMLKVDHVHKYEQPGKRDEEGKYQKPEEPTYNAMPPELSGSDDSSDSDSEGPDDPNIDPDDPMASFLRDEKKKNRSKKLKGGAGEKEEKKRRKEERRRKREEKERRRLIRELKEKEGGGKGKGKAAKREREEREASGQPRRQEGRVRDRSPKRERISPGLDSRLSRGRDEGIERRRGDVEVSPPRRRRSPEIEPRRGDRDMLPDPVRRDQGRERNGNDHDRRERYDMEERYDDRRPDRRRDNGYDRRAGQ